jgi:hypothetical protein
MLALAAARARTVTLVMQVLHFTLEKLIRIAVVMNRVEDLSVVFLLWLRGRETRVNILGNDTKLLVASSCEAREIRFFKGTILIQSTTHEIGAVRKVGSILGVSDSL